MNIACLFGSFNPVHNGHLLLAKQVNMLSDVDEVWFVISPQNPFKMDMNLLDSNNRLKMLELSISSNNSFKICDIEMDMDRPSYTHKTLSKLNETFPNNTFSLIIGSDALNNIDKWRMSDEIIKYPIITSIRDNEDISEDILNIIPKLSILKSNSKISSTDIRKKIYNDLPITNLTPNSVIKYIEDNELYRYQ